MARPHLTIAQVELALRQAAGNVTYAARELGVSRNTLYNRIAASEHLRQVLQEAREELVDIAEYSLRRAVEGGEAWAVCFTLKTVGRSRGYVERQELAGVSDAPLRVRWVNDAEDEQAGADDIAPAST